MFCIYYRSTSIKNNIILKYFLHYNTNNIKTNIKKESNTILNTPLINISFFSRNEIE